MDWRKFSWHEDRQERRVRVRTNRQYGSREETRRQKMILSRSICLVYWYIYYALSI